MTDVEDIDDFDHDTLDGMDDLDEAPDHSVPPTSPDLISENAARLAEIFPEAVREDGIDFEVLKEILGEDLSEGEERYGLDWAGKSLARRIAARPSTGTLRPDPDDSVEWKTTDNLMIEGDNLEVLKLLQKSYAGKVKLIYIDPPYNTGKDFVYKDNYKDNITNYLRLTGQVDEEGSPLSSNVETSGRFHTDWLNMMYPRLKLAWELLSEDGVIFISIDDHEVANLRLMLDEIFGAPNLIEAYIWESNFRPDNSSTIERENAQYVLCFARSKGKVEGLVGSQKATEGLPSLTKKSMKRSSLTFQPEWVDLLLPDGLYPAGQRESGYLVEDDVKVVDGRAAGSFTLTGNVIWSQQYLEDQIAAGTRIVIKSDGFVPYSKKSETSTLAPTTLIPRDVAKDVLHGNSEIRSLFSEPVFSHPKPTTLVKYLVQSVGSKDDESLILDFFAGSGTTGHAVMAQNAEDGGNRRFILVQLPEPLDPEVKEQKVAAEFCDELEKPRNIAELTKERLRRAAAKVKEENPDFDGDTGFRVLKLDSSNVVAWDPETKDIEGSLKEQVNPVKEDRTELDLLFEGLLKLGIDPTSPIEEREVEGARVMSVGEGRLMACLADGLDREAVVRVADGIIAWVNELDTADDVTCLFRDSSFVGDAAKAELIARLTQAEMAENLRFI